MEFILSFMIISYLFVVMAIWIAKRMFNTYEQGDTLQRKKRTRKSKKVEETLSD